AGGGAGGAGRAGGGGHRGRAGGPSRPLRPPVRGGTPGRGDHPRTPPGPPPRAPDPRGAIVSLAVQARQTSTMVSKVASPAENPKTSRTSSDKAGRPDVRRLRPSHPSWIHSVPAETRSVTWA